MRPQVKLARTTKKPSSSSAAAPPSVGDKSGNVTYELLMKPDNAKLESAERVARIDRRLEALEKALGATPEAMVRDLVKNSSQSWRMYCCVFAIPLQVRVGVSLSVATGEWFSYYDTL